MYCFYSCYSEQMTNRKPSHLLGEVLTTHCSSSLVVLGNEKQKEKLHSASPSVVCLTESAEALLL